MTGTPRPRIYCLAATRAPIVAVFRRGPSAWSHVGRWDLRARRYEPGAWLRGRIFPRRSDVSPDGRYLCYFAHQPRATWEHGEAYVAVSRLPWLTALHAFPTAGTWSRGYRFAEGNDGAGGRAEERPIPARLSPIPVVQFANERRRGWEESADSPERDPHDAWDQRRNARLEKRQPGGDLVLRVESLGWAGGEFGADQAVDGLRVGYWLEVDGDLRSLDDLQWADWDPEGNLLAATRGGQLQVRRVDEWADDVLFAEDLAALEPAPAAAPPWAGEW
jgi:hypothetical protein